MNREFKLKYDQLQENDPTKTNTFINQTNENYPGISNTRTLSFSWPEGRKLFLNYSYLVSGEHLPFESAIILTFTSHVITIKGNNMDQVFEQLLLQTIKQIVCADNRYLSLENEITLIYEITVEIT